MCITLSANSLFVPLSLLFHRHRYDFDSEIPVILMIHVPGGLCLPKLKGRGPSKIIDPYIKLSLFDVKNDEKELNTTNSTSVMTSNDFFPIWNTEKFFFWVENGSTTMLHLSAQVFGMYHLNVMCHKFYGKRNVIP